MRLAVARVVAALPLPHQSTSQDLVRAAADHLHLDSDRDVKAAVTRKEEKS